MKKLIASIVLAAGVVLAIPTAANAATCGAYGLTQSANTAAPGAVVSVTACFGEAPGTPVSTSFNGPGVGSGPANVTPAASTSSTLGASGAVTYTVTIPSSAVNGDIYSVGAATGTSSFSGTIVAVVAPSSNTTGSGLPNTGFDITPVALIGGGLLLVGGIAAGAVAVRRSRKTAA